MKLPRPSLRHGLASVGPLVFAFTFAFQLQAAPPVAVNDSVVMHHLLKTRIAVLANDTGNVSSPTVTIMQAPQSGSAVSDSAGRILYTHQSGAPASDSFTYRVTSAEGTSNTATVTVAFSNSLRISGSFNVPATPPPLAVQLTPVVTGLSSPTAIATPPGETRRVFVCQKGGSLRLVQDITAATPTVSTFLNLANVLTLRGESLSTTSEQGLLGLAFHPNYAANRYFYLFYSVTAGGIIYERVSRFTTSATDPNVADTGSEVVLIQQRDEATNHNGGDLHFGPDGYLYISLGDEGSQHDSLNNSQTITKDFFSAVARIDVDKKPGSLPPNTHAAVVLTGGVASYAVPPDNPYVGATTFNGVTIANTAAIRTEFWAVGFRNPWRFSFDSLTGELWLGDVGQDTYEEIDIVTKGRNYGWAYREGANNGSKSGQAPENFDSLYHTPPLYEYVHTSVVEGDAIFKGNSVSGGVVYRGTRHSNLIGAYIFSDHVSGHIWSLVRNATGPPTVTRIAGESNVVAFGKDPSNQDVLLVDYNDGRLLRLTSSAGTGTYPATLSATGLFADLADLSPSPGLLPYAPNLAFWSDHAVKSRWFSIPTAGAAMTWSRDGQWTFPNGQIWVKHFDLPLNRDNPTTRKRLETRVLVKNASGAYGVSYRWNDAGTEATLVPDAGVEFDVNITAGGNPSVQRWRIPSRAECMICHTSQAGHALSFSTRQLNLSQTVNSFSGNLLTLLSGAGYFTNTPEAPNVLPRHVRLDEVSQPVESRVRSYLAVNCAYCHMAGGSAAPAAWDGRIELALDQTGLINGTAVNNSGSTVNKLVVPGDTAHSVLLNRVAVTNGFTRMPPIGSNQLDTQAIDLLTTWISSSLPTRQTFTDWRLQQFGSSNSTNGDPLADPDNDGVNNTAEYLASTSPLDGASFFKAEPAVTGPAGDTITVTFSVPPNRSAVVETSTNLSDWFYWDVPGNSGLPQAGGPVTLTGPAEGSRQFFRVRLRDH